jgi:transcription elongation factor Elf1
MSPKIGDMENVIQFRCPTCESEYKVVRVEVPLSGNEHPLTCLGCGTPLRNREGKFILKYISASTGAP